MSSPDVVCVLIPCLRSAHQEALLEQDRDVTERRKAARELLNSLRIDDDAEDEGQEVFDRNVDDAAHDAAVINMNAGQKQQYDEIIAHVRAQVIIYHKYLYIQI